VQVRAWDLYPNQNTRTRYLRAGTWDLNMSFRLRSTYVVTRSRPYVWKVLAVSGWRLGTHQGTYVVTRSRPYLCQVLAVGG